MTGTPRPGQEQVCSTAQEVALLEDLTIPDGSVDMNTSTKVKANANFNHTPADY